MEKLESLALHLFNHLMLCFEVELAKIASKTSVYPRLARRHVLASSI